MKVTENILSWDIQRVSRLIKTKEVSPVEITKQMLERIDSVDPKLNSFITVASDQAVEQAKMAEKDILTGDYKGPLHGIPIGLKDIIFTKGLRTTMGSEIYEDYVPDHSATVVNKLEQSGAIIIGKLNTHQFAYGPTGDRSHFGPVRNPHDTNKITGGSSSGAGAAVAACLSYGALGTDTGGSVRIPSSFCGIVGMKPTFGRVSKFGVFPLSWTLDNVGPMTRTVTDNAILLNGIAGHDPNDPYSLSKKEEDFTRHINKGIRGMKIGLPTSFYFEGLDEEVEQSVRSAISVLSSLGAEIKEVDIPHIEEIMDAHKTILKSEAYAVHEQRLKDYPDKWDEEVKERLLTGLNPKGFEYAKALQMKQIALNDYKKVMEGVDVLITPTIPILPVEINNRHVDIEKYKGQHIRWSILKLTSPTNFNGLPSLSLPCGLSKQGMPIGIQFIGRQFEEAELYRFGFALEQEL